MEKAEAPEHRSFHWSYNESFANRLGVDVERNSDEVRQGKPERESDQLGEPFFAVSPDQSCYHVKLLDVAEGLDYLHANHAVHGNLEGVDISIWSPRAPLVTFC